jgi:Tol biopolymer transport system component/DNA-binding winged helix-turn-helix (wHTH) protein
MHEQKKRFYDFAPYRLDPDKRVLLKDGVPVPLTPKAFDTLVTLVEEREHLLQKDVIINRVWPDSFVEEGNLTVTISMLRKALGDNRSGNRYIVTVPGKGYRFVADVQEFLYEEPADVILERKRTHVIIEEDIGWKERITRFLFLISVVSVFQRLTLSWKTVAAAIATLGLIAVGVVWAISTKIPAPDNSITSLRMTQLTSWKVEPGAPATFPRFSSNGGMMTFSSTKSGHSNIWIKQVTNGEPSGEPIQITNSEWTDRSPIWSPDNQQIAFISDRGNQFAIWKIPFMGGTPTMLKTLENTFGQLTHWSRDGRTIYYSIDHNLFALDVASGQTTQLTSFDPATALTQDFSISPNEDRIAYADSKNGQFDIWRMPIQGDVPVQVTNDTATDRQPVWHPDGERIIYSSNQGGAYQICVAYLDGRPIVRLLSGDSDNLAPAVSSDGSHILYNTTKEESDLWGVKLDGGQEFEVTSDNGSEFWPDISPDGKSILFQTGCGSERLMNCLIKVRPTATEGQQVQVAADGSDSTWSPDGSKISFLRSLNGQCNIWLINAVGGAANQLTSEGMTQAQYSVLPYNRAEVGGYSWSPNSTKIAYCSSKSGEGNIWVVSTDGSTDQKISNNTDSKSVYHRPLWSQDGTRIVSILAPRASFVDGNSTWKLWVSDAENSGIIYSSRSHLRLIGWSSSAGTVMLTADETPERSVNPKDINLLQIPIAGGGEQVIATLKMAYPTNIKISPNGQYLAFVSRQDGKDNVWIIPAVGGTATKLTTNNDPRMYLSSLAWSPDSKGIYYGKQSKTSIISQIDNFR